MWAAGLAAASGLVAAWRIAGPGYLWLSGSVTLLFGIPAALSGSGAWAMIGIGAVALAIPLARTALAPFLFVLGGLAFGIDAVSEGGVAASLTGAVLLARSTVTTPEPVVDNAVEGTDDPPAPRPLRSVPMGF